MPSLKTYDLFISHAWKYGSSYDRVKNFLDTQPLFLYRNYSAPTDKPLIPAGTTVPNREILQKIENKIRPVNCVIVLAGMYASYSSWIEAEVRIAKKYNKPIIGIKPWGNTRVPNFISDNADEIVSWQQASLINAIRNKSL